MKNYFLFEESFVDQKKTIEVYGKPINNKSRLFTRCLCGKESSTTIGDLAKSYKKYGDCRCVGCRIKQKWEDPKYKEKQSLIIKKRWEEPEYAQCISNSLSEFWSNDEKKKNQSIRQKKIWADSKLQEKHHQSMVEKWKDPNYREKAAQASRSRWTDKEFLKKASERSKKKWDEAIYREKVAHGQITWKKNCKSSGIEVITHKILENLKIDFIKHHTIGPWEFDIYIPNKKILIECQGEYWHSLERVKSKDASKASYVSNYLLDHKIIYLYERQFLNPQVVKSELSRRLFAVNKSTEQHKFDLKDLMIKELSIKDKLPSSYYSEPEEFLQSYHYAGFGRSPKHIYGAYLNQQLIAVCKFTSVVRKEVATSEGFKHKEVLELDRFCIHPHYQKKNFASWFISKCKKFVPKSIKLLVSFADNTVGHIGTIYRAAGWDELGIVKPSYHYINDDGWVIHKKTLYNHAVKMKKTERQYAEENGYQKVWGKEKIKFGCTINNDDKNS